MQRGIGGIVPLILNLGNRLGEWSASRANLFILGQREPVTIVLEARCTPHSPSEFSWGKTNLLPTPGIETWFLGRCRLCEGNEISFHFKESNSNFRPSKRQASHFLTQKSGHDARNSRKYMLKDRQDDTSKYSSFPYYTGSLFYQTTIFCHVLVLHLAWAVGWVGYVHAAKQRIACGYRQLSDKIIIVTICTFHHTLLNKGEWDWQDM
jgi:hypothetical protein